MRAAETETPRVRRRPAKAAMQLLRRAHLYFGLFLFPWAVLYGVTAFLFNHPTAFSDQPTVAFGPETLVGTPMAAPPTPAEEAARVVAALGRRDAGTAYTLVEPEKAGYAREFAFATAKADDRTVNVLIDVTGGGGTIRAGAAPKKEERAPFAVGGRPGGGRREQPAREAGGGLKLDDGLHERVKAAVPAVLERTGSAAADVTVTSVPDLTFLMDAHGKTWRVTYNAQTGAVAGKPADGAGGEPLSVRRFLTRLHLAHGYPPSVGARWFWAVVVDLMAAVMVFWGVSGLLMWWQIKATRAAGAVVLALSAAAAAALAVGMHSVLTQ